MPMTDLEKSAVERLLDDAEKRGGQLTFSYSKDRKQEPWMAGYVFGREDSLSDLAAGAAYGMGPTLGDALGGVARDMGWGVQSG